MRESRETGLERGELVALALGRGKQADSCLSNIILCELSG